jgi:ribosomal protein S21
VGKKAIVYVDGYNDESFEHLLRRFNRSVQEAGVLSELSQRQYFEKPSLRRHHQEQKMKRKIEDQQAGMDAEEEMMVIKRPRRNADELQRVRKVFRAEAAKFTEKDWRTIV